MNDGCARAEDAGSKAFPTHLVGVGPDEEFATAKQLTSGPVTWLGNLENLEAFLDRPPLAHPCVILLDGDLPSERLIASLDQNAALLKATPMLLQITKPPVRLAVVIMQRGVRDVLQKPYTLARLRAALEELRSLYGRHP